ncbi:hypothetical protein V8C35DRAFT_27747 [Trichoderma chlorosporum]
MSPEKSGNCREFKAFASAISVLSKPTPKHRLKKRNLLMKNSPYIQRSFLLREVKTTAVGLTEIQRQLNHYQNVSFSRRDWERCMLTFTIDKRIKDTVEELAVKKENKGIERGLQEKEEEDSMHGYDTDATEILSESDLDKWFKYKKSTRASERQIRSLDDDRNRKRSLDNDSERERKKQRIS